MSTGIQRRSARISKLEEQKTQEVKGRNKTIGKARLEGLGSRKDNARLKQRKKLSNNKSGRDLVSSSGHEVLPRNHAVKISENILPERRKLRVLLDRLQRRDRHKIFANPVNADEAKGYYDIIKEPMDFGTISSKLDGGRYRTLAEFEYDVTLVHKNAMLFNASTTTYYVQGLYIRDLARKLFMLLKTDPENFEREVASIGQRARSTDTVVQSSKSGPCVQSTDVAEDGETQHARYDEKDEPESYNSWDSLLNNESIMSLLYKNPEPIISETEGKIDEVGYKEILMRLVNNLV